MTTRPISIKTLAHGFADHIKQLKSPDYKESQIRLHYIDPFWQLLGWDVSNTAQRAPQDVEVQVEPTIDTVDDAGARSREPDYLFRVNGFPRFIVEAKKPAVSIDHDHAAIFQAKRYAWSASIPFAILTDFEQFRLYDTTLKPDIKLPGRGLVADWKLEFQDYPSKWDTIAATFGRDAVAAGSLETLLAQVKKIKAGRRVRSADRMLIDLKGAEPIDRDFLDYLQKFREHFARAIYHDNKKAFPEADSLHGAARLTEVVQRLIDRLVFMRVCEDRSVSRYGDLRDILQRASAEGGLTELLRAEFRSLDRSYNGYLFKYHELLDQIALPEDTLADFIRTIYPPDGPWDFARVADDILGIIYERFLGHTVTVKRGTAIVEEKPEIRHAGGVYYTPRFVVDTIIRRVVGPKIVGKSPTQVLDTKVLDPACGSGSFIVVAFQYLMDHCLAAIAANPSLASVPASPKARKKRKDIAFKDRKGRWHLAPDFRAALLTHCIHGVDIDQQAVEVTVMSLYLKMLEGELPADWQKDWLENELLPSLDSNILCGNSLIDTADYDNYLTFKKSGLFAEDADTRFRINRFDWRSQTRGFGALYKARKVESPSLGVFDCVIGNPPYIRVQELNKWAPDECAFYKWKYKSAAKGNYDIYVVFVERCLSLLTLDGLLGFIMPHKFWQAEYGAGLRKLIADGKHLRAVVDFGDQQVFKGATTYTAIHVLTGGVATSGVDYAKIIELDDGGSQCREIETGRALTSIRRFVASQPNGASSWAFFDSGIAAFMARVADSGPTLGDYAEKIFVGLQTSADQVFILERRGNRYWSEQLDALVDMEPTYLHPLLKGSVHMKRWVPLPTPRVVLFPYELHGSQFELVASNHLENRAPLTWDYMLRCRTHLASRERGTYEGERWYGYVYPKNFASMSKRKLLTPSLGQRAEYSFDEKGDQFFVGSGGGGGGGYGILLPSSASYEYVLGLLNSSLLDWYLKQITTPFHNGWFAYNKQFIEKVPIKIPETADEEKKALRIAESVRTIMVAKTRLQTVKLSDRERSTLEGEIEAHENRIDEIVFDLYGVSGLPT